MTWVKDHLNFAYWYHPSPNASFKQDISGGGSDWFVEKTAFEEQEHEMFSWKKLVLTSTFLRFIYEHPSRWCDGSIPEINYVTEWWYSLFLILYPKRGTSVSWTRPIARRVEKMPAQTWARQQFDRLCLLMTMITFVAWKTLILSTDSEEHTESVSKHGDSLDSKNHAIRDVQSGSKERLTCISGPKWMTCGLDSIKPWIREQSWNPSVFW